MPPDYCCLLHCVIGWLVGVCSKHFQANEILLAFHRVLSVQLTMPHIRSDEPLSDDDEVDNCIPPASLPSNSLEGAAVAVN